MSSYSKLIIVGNLGRDPEFRYTPNGKAVTSFSVATNRRYAKSDGQEVDETTWHRVTAWGRQAETCNQYLRKGSKVLIEGRLKPDPETGGPRVYQRNDGSWGASFEVTAQFVKFMDSKGSPRGENQKTQDTPDEDGIPF